MRRKNFSKLLILALMTLSVGACSKNQSDGGNAAQSAPDKAESLALAGEKMAYGDGFLYANDNFDEALKLDSKNARARFYKAALGVIMVNKGILTRIQPVVNRLGTKQQADYAQFVNTLPAGNIRTFLLDGRQDIVTENDAQNYVRSIQTSLRQLRSVLGDLRDSNVVLQLHVQSDGQNGMSACRVKKVGPGKFQSENCASQTETLVAMSYPDFEAARLVVAGYIVYMSSATAYDLSGGENVVRKFMAQGTVTQKGLVDLIQTEKQLGKLADVAALKEILDMGIEGIEAVKYAAAHQGDLCKTGMDSKLNRPGSLFAEGFCIPAQAMNYVPMAEAALHGPVGFSYGPNQQRSSVIDVTKPLNGSVTDLKDLLPTQFDGCGQATGIPDGTLGGLFPNGDAVSVIQWTGNPGFLNPQSCRPLFRRR